MGRLPSSFREHNRTTRSFRELFAKLPESIQAAVRSAAVQFDRDPNHPALRRHALEDRQGASHVPTSFSVSITMQYRAIYVVVDGVNVWYWIGTHAAYKIFTKSKR